MNSNVNDKNYNKYIKYKSKYLHELIKQLEDQRDSIIQSQTVKTEQEILSLQNKIAQAKETLALTRQESAKVYDIKLDNCPKTMSDPSVRNKIDDIKRKELSLNEIVTKTQQQISYLENQIAINENTIKKIGSDNPGSKELQLQINKYQEYLSAPWEIKYYVKQSSYDVNQDYYDFSLNLLKDLFEGTPNINFTISNDTTVRLQLLKMNMVLCSNAIDEHGQSITQSGKLSSNSITPRIDGVQDHYKYHIFKCIYFNILYDSHKQNSIKIKSLHDIKNIYPKVVVLYDFLLLSKVILNYVSTYNIQGENIVNSIKIFYDLLTNKLGFDNLVFPSTIKFNLIDLNWCYEFILTDATFKEYTPFIKYAILIKLYTNVFKILFKNSIVINKNSFGSVNYIPELDVVYKVTKSLPGNITATHTSYYKHNLFTRGENIQLMKFVSSLTDVKHLSQPEPVELPKQPTGREMIQQMKQDYEVYKLSNDSLLHPKCVNDIYLYPELLSDLTKVTHPTGYCVPKNDANNYVYYSSKLNKLLTEQDLQGIDKRRNNIIITPAPLAFYDNLTMNDIPGVYNLYDYNTRTSTSEPHKFNSKVVDPKYLFKNGKPVEELTCASDMKYYLGSVDLCASAGWDGSSFRQLRDGIIKYKKEEEQQTPPPPPPPQQQRQPQQPATPPQAAWA